MEVFIGRYLSGVDGCHAKDRRAPGDICEYILRAYTGLHLRRISGMAGRPGLFPICPVVLKLERKSKRP